MSSFEDFEERGETRALSALHAIQARYARVDPTSYLPRPGESSLHYWTRRLGALKPVELLLAEYEFGQLRKVLKAWQLVFIGIGCVVGTGIFVLSGQAAARNAGPAVAISFVIAAIAAAFAAFSYSEMASMIPVSGSAYTYAYATMGEFVAWTLGWDLVLEYMVGAAAVGVGWSGYFVKFFEECGTPKFSASWTQPTLVWEESPPSIAYRDGQYFNVPGFVIIWLVTAVLVIGIRESAALNTITVSIKLFIIALFIFGLCGFIDHSNYVPYIPPNIADDWRLFGNPGIFAGASVVFFSYIGFDSVTTAALEAKNPRRDLPIGIIGSLAITSVIYVIFCTIMTGAENYTRLDVATPVLAAITATQERTGKSFQWLSIIVSLGAAIGLISVIIILLLAQSRVFFAMASDGLLPRVFAKVHPRFKTPYISTIFVGAVTSILSAILPVDLLGNMSSVGTLLTFFIVHAGVILLRFTRPDVERKFAIPGGKYLWIFFPITGMVICILLIAVAEVTTIWRLFVWLAIGWIVYFSYSIRHSRLHKDPVERFKEVSLRVEGRKSSIYSGHGYDDEYSSIL